MYAGELRQSIVIEQPVEGAVDAHGRRTVTWTEYKSCMASVREVSGKEFYAAAAMQMEDVETFGVRYDSGITTAMRIRFEGGVYEIMQINRLGRMGDFMLIKARMSQPEVM